MEFYECISNDSRIIRGLFSRSNNEKYIVVHIHGFGGDCFANKFVKQMHSNFPEKGISFLSFNSRYSGYVNEEYSENKVIYSGAAVENFNNAIIDIEAVLDDISKKYEICILQGHSFGTNIVKLFSRVKNWQLPLIFLSPSDSVFLYQKWIKHFKPSVKQNMQEEEKEDYFLSMNIFGIHVDNCSYPIPISRKTFDGLIKSEVFNEWSKICNKIQNPSLVITGVNDKIANQGNIYDKKMLNMMITNLTHQEIIGAKHLFEGYETELISKITNWIISFKNILG